MDRARCMTSATVRLQLIARIGQGVYCITSIRLKGRSSWSVRPSPSPAALNLNPLLSARASLVLSVLAGVLMKLFVRGKADELAELIEFGKFALGHLLLPETLLTISRKHVHNQEDVSWTWRSWRHLACGGDGLQEGTRLHPSPGHIRALIVVQDTSVVESWLPKSLVDAYSEAPELFNFVTIKPRGLDLSILRTSQGLCATEGCEAAPRKRCSRCRRVKYCGEECQRRSWRCHKPVCAGHGAGVNLTQLRIRGERSQAILHEISTLTWDE